MTKTSQYYQGLNDKSYNGQDYKSTLYTRKSNGYWYTDTTQAKSDATDNVTRRNTIVSYSRNENGVAITNHKAEVFNSYKKPLPEHITKEINRELANELEEKTYCYADTHKMEIEVEYATQTSAGNKVYSHAIKGVDFGIVERPKAEVTLDQDVKNIKVTLADGTVLFDTESETNNIMWIANGEVDKYDKNELIHIFMDEELLSGAQLEVTYYLTVTNNSENELNAVTKINNIINYVQNNLNFDIEDNKVEGKAQWEVVSKDAIQTNQKSTLVNNTVVDLSTQSIILKATQDNPLIKTNLQPGQQVTGELVLKKMLSAESSQDEFRYTNMAELVEIDNTLGRYDHLATPGNQRLDLQPQEHDTAGASAYIPYDENANIDPEHPQDGTIIITPPTGSTHIYYGIGIIVTLVLAGGIILIKKFVLNNKNIE